MPGKEMWLREDFFKVFWEAYDTVHLAEIMVSVEQAEDDIANRRTYRWFPDREQEEPERHWFVCGRCMDDDHDQCLNDYYNDDNCACDHHGGIDELRVREVPQR